jgi:transposase InsO family protein
VIDTFTKWVEAEPVGQITKENTVKFLRSIVLCFGVPHQILSDSGTQFTNKKFENFCERHAIKHYWSSVYHPMTNGQVECANDIILQGIKTRIFDRLSAYDKKWVEELPTVFWAVHTTANQATGETPIFLVYGAEAILPPKVRLNSPRVAMFSEDEQADHRYTDLELLEEKHDIAAFRVEKY